MQELHSQDIAPFKTNISVPTMASNTQGHANDPVCPICATSFKLTRKDKKYCSRPCARKATRNATRGSRKRENEAASALFTNRAATLAYEVNRQSTTEKRKTILALLEAASGTDATLRRILTNPALLGAKWGDPIGKMFPDNKYPTAPNIAKLVNSFCKQEWGCSTRTAILDHGKPANREFNEVSNGEATVKVPPYIYEEPMEAYEQQDPTQFISQLKKLRAA